MMLAAMLYRGAGRVAYCAKLNHGGNARRIFNCAYHELASKNQSPGGDPNPAPANHP